MSRKSLRKKVVEILKRNQILEVGDDVFSGRSVPTDHELLPAILVYTKSESVDRFDEAPKSYKRGLQITLEAITTNDTDEKLSDDLDDLAQGIENAMERDGEDLFALVNEYDLISVLYDTEGSGSNPVGKVQLTYLLDYNTDESPDPVHPDLARMQTKYKVNGHTDDDTNEIVEFDIDPLP